MSLYNVFARHALAPSLDLLRGTRTMKCLTELEESQWWSRERIEALQAERLQRLVAYAYNKVPYYHRLMIERGLRPHDIQSVRDITKLPVLTKELIRANLDDMCAVDLPRDTLFRGRTSGSTGEPLLFYSTRAAQYNHGYAVGLRSMRWAGIRLGDRTVSVCVRTRDETGWEHFLREWSRRLKRTTEVDTTSISDATLPYVVHKLHGLRPRAFTAYPSVMAHIASFIKDSGLPAPPVHSILTGGEQLFEHQRELITDVFHSAPFSRYGSHEVYEMAAECEKQSGLHVHAEDIIAEVVDEDGTPVPAGQQGNMLVTNLHSYGMPFIRYQNGDSGSLSTSPCTCGRGLPLLGTLLGRTADIIRTPSGKHVAGVSLALSRLAVLGVTHFQILQEELDKVVIHVVLPHAKEPCQQSEAGLRVEDILRRGLGKDMRIEVVFTEHIEPTSAGKHVPIVSKLAPRAPRSREEEKP